MGKQRELYKGWKRANQQLEAVFEPAEHTVLIHYSCESFYDRDDNPRSPRVTSIAVRNFDSGQTKSFSIHLVAERRGVLDSIEQHYDQLEREMLEDFFQAVRERQYCKWLHWNMRDANYGFEALENRFKALGGVPSAVVAEDKRFDLSRMLVSIYGVGYIGHPRLENLMTKNSVTAPGLSHWQARGRGIREQAVRKTASVHAAKGRCPGELNWSSTCRRSENACDLWELNGRSVKAVGEWLREHWVVGGIVAVLGLTTAIARAWPWLSGLLA